MSNTNTGEPAFPVLHWINGESTGAEEGMTLRDYFAAKAMQATMQAWISTSQYPSTDMEVAVNAYAVADAMLEARQA
jgi:hypothetical protein